MYYTRNCAGEKVYGEGGEYSAVVQEWQKTWRVNDYLVNYAVITS